MATFMEFPGVMVVNCRYSQGPTASSDPSLPLARTQSSEVLQTCTAQPDTQRNKAINDITMNFLIFVSL